MAIGLLFKGSLEEPVAQLLLVQPRVAGASAVAFASSFEGAAAAGESRSAYRLGLRHHGCGHACAGPSNACFQSGSRSFVQWLPQQT